MKRHLSSRGEPLAEVTASRMLVGRQRRPKSAIISQADRRYKPEQPWFLQTEDFFSRPKPKTTNGPDAAIVQ